MTDLIARLGDVAAMHDDLAIATESERAFGDAQQHREAAVAVREAASALAAREWQDISTAPKMRTILLFAVTDVGPNGEARNWKMATGSWHVGYEDETSRARNLTPWNWDGSQLKTYEVQPTHWQHLPSPPATEGATTPAQEGK